MVRLDRIYTRTGDDGTTGLVGGERVSKDDPRIEAYGSVDELNACVGLVRERNMRHGGDEPARAQLDALLETVQQRLFNLGSSLATRFDDRREGQPVLTSDHVEELERVIDALNEDLEPLTSFILPGGGPVGAMLHLARTVCRRAERATLSLSRRETIDGNDLRYLNRLSDALFVMGRWIAKRQGEPEPLWNP